jgi:uncharacterized protein (DUF1697 family)
VNVGGQNRVAMADLRELAADLGFRNAQTLLQSGNLVFEADDSGADLETLLESETSKRLGVETDFFVRSADEWRQMVDDNPFPDEAKDDPGHLLVMPLKSPPAPNRVEALQESIKGREVVRSGGGHVYLVYPDGIGRSKLTAQRIEKALGARGTARNWNTALKLMALADPA